MGRDIQESGAGISNARDVVTAHLVSAVIPCYNGAAFLEEAVTSVLRQTRHVDEVIVVDDCSTDNSSTIAARLGAKSIRLPTHAGPSAARNCGIAASRGDLIAFLDADDYWCPTHCENVVALLERHPDCAVAFSRIRRFGATPESVSPAYRGEDLATPVLWHLLDDNIVPQSTVVARRFTLQDHGGYDESRRHSEDFDLWIRLAQHHPFVYTNEVTASYRVHPGQASADVEKNVQAHWEVKHQFWKEATAHESGAVVARLERLLLRRWNATLKSAWWMRDEELFLATLGLQDHLIPGISESYHRWKRRYRLAWPAWRVLSRAWDQLPVATRQVLRPPLTSLFAPQDSDLL